MRIFLVLCVLTAAQISIDIEGLPRSFSKDYFNPCRSNRRLNALKLAKLMAVMTKAFPICAPKTISVLNIDQKALIFVARQFCALVSVFYYFNGDKHGRLPPEWYKNGSLVFHTSAPLLQSIAKAGAVHKCIRVGVEKVCYHRRAVFNMYVEAMKCYLDVSHGIAPQSREEQLVLVQYALERLF